MLATRPSSSPFLLSHLANDVSARSAFDDDEDDEAAASNLGHVPLQRRFFLDLKSYFNRHRSLPIPKAIT